jgi:TolA-binding protein
MFFGCANDSDKNAIEVLEQKLEASKNPKDAEVLLEAYNNYITAHPDDINNARYLYRSASTLFRMNRFTTATEHLKHALSDYYESDNSAKTSELLSEIYDAKLKNPSAAATVRQAMLAAFPEYDNIAKVKEKIPEGASPFQERMKTLTAQMFNEVTGKIDYREANNFILNCELYTLVNPKGAENPTILHQAAETARSIKSFPKALELYQRIYNQYPSSDRAPQALFLHGFTLDNDLKKYDEAKVQYEAFIKKYPDNDFADDAAFLLENLGKSEEELIRNFQKK